MTNIYTYCLFDNNDVFYGVYSSLSAVHRDAIKICNQGMSTVLMEHNGRTASPDLRLLRNTLRGECDVMVRYRSDAAGAKILKTKLKE